MSYILRALFGDEDGLTGPQDLVAANDHLLPGTEVTVHDLDVIPIGTARLNSPRYGLGDTVLDDDDPDIGGTIGFPGRGVTRKNMNGLLE